MRIKELEAQKIAQENEQKLRTSELKFRTLEIARSFPCDDTQSLITNASLIWDFVK
jgi:hypothetical protein